MFNKFRKSGFDMMIVGLGNPGLQYEGTRHNIGFACIDALCKKHNIKCDKMKFTAYIGDSQLCGKRVLMLKPLTYMNNSGEAIGAAARFYKIPASNILVIYDDVSLAVGKLRIRTRGSAGGHNGIKDIIANLSTDEFPRIKVGVGEKPHPDYPLDKWVLSKFRDEDLAEINNATERAVCAVEEALTSSLTVAMNKYSK